MCLFVDVWSGYSICPYLQDEVPRKQPIRTSSRTVLIQTLYVDTPQVSSTECDPYFHPRPANCYEPRLTRFPAPLRRHPGGQQESVTEIMKCNCVCVIVSSRLSLHVYLIKLRGLVVGVVCLEEGVSVPSSCSLSVSMVE